MNPATDLADTRPDPIVPAGPTLPARSGSPDWFHEATTPTYDAPIAPAPVTADAGRSEHSPPTPASPAIPSLGPSAVRRAVIAVSVISGLVATIGGPAPTGSAVVDLVMVAGAIGITLHYQGNVEFQLEVHPELSGWALFANVLHAKAPPALAPGVMAQLGFLGLIYTVKHPALRDR